MVYPRLSQWSELTTTSTSGANPNVAPDSLPFRSAAAGRTADAAGEAFDAIESASMSLDRLRAQLDEFDSDDWPRPAA